MDYSIAAIFAAGLLTFASPCVLPLMPVYLATIAGGSLSEAKPRRTLQVAAAFAAGMSLVFVLLGALASTLGSVLLEQRTTLLVLSGALMVLFGLRALGVLRVRMLDVDARPALHRIGAASTMAGAFVFGAAFALGWSPCIGPVLASVLTFAATHAESPWRGAGYLAVYAAGLSAPLLLIAGAAARASAWLKRFRSAIPRLEKVTGVALVAVGLWTLLGSVPAEEPALANREAVAPAAEQEACETGVGPGRLCALPEQAAGEVDDELNVVGPHMLEFTSEECPVCGRMRPVLDRLTAACAELETGIVRIDVTTARGRALAARHGVRGTPTFVLFDESGAETARLLGETSREDVAAAVERAFGLSCWG